MNNEIQEEINLIDLINIFKKHSIKIIAIVTIITSTVFFYSSFGMTKEYTSTGIMIINNRQSDSVSITNDEINSAKGLTSVYSIILKSEPILEKIIDQLKLDIEVQDLNSMISISSMNGTQVMKISAVSESPDLSSTIVNQILELAPLEIEDKVEAGTAKIISRGTPNYKSTSPNILVYTLGSFSASLFLCFIFFIAFELKDKTIRSPQDIDTFLGYPLLGTIPNVGSLKGEKKHAQRKKIR